jgi:hypothetical protein
MLSLQCLFLFVLLGGIAGPPPPDPVPILRLPETPEELKLEIEAAAKSAEIDEPQALAFAARAVAMGKAGKNAATRVGALDAALKIPLRKKSADLAAQRDVLWDLVIEEDAQEGVLLAPLVARNLKDEARLEKLRKKTKAPELKATFAFMDLLPQINKRDRNEQETKDLIAAIEKLKKEHGSVADPMRKQTWAETCDGVLFPIQKLAIGMEVPDIEGKDTAGVAFKLSDYRGKVVLLDFWGHW